MLGGCVERASGGWGSDWRCSLGLAATCQSAWWVASDCESVRRPVGVKRSLKEFHLLFQVTRFDIFQQKTIQTSTSCTRKKGLFFLNQNVVLLADLE